MYQTFVKSCALWLLSLHVLSSSARAFVLVSGPEEAKLDADVSSPIVHFAVGNEAPEISEKEEFLGGIYADLNDVEFLRAMIEETMNVWNDVSTAYIELRVDDSLNAAISRDDRINSVVTGGVNATSAAFARPEVEDGSIVDCDIVIGNKAIKARSLAYTMLHEFGHCLGLGHNHSNYDAVMGYSREDQRLRLGTDDKIGLTYLYPEESISSPRETLGCASIGSASAHHPWSLLVALILPGIFAMLRRRKD